MRRSSLVEELGLRENTLTLRHIFENSKADSGGERDVKFLRYLIDSNLLLFDACTIKRKTVGLPELYYLDRYKKMNYESDRHFLCRAIIQEELKKIGIETTNSLSMGNMEVLRENSSYDIVTFDFTAIIDVGLTPARNYFRGLTDLRIKDYLLATYFDDYMDDIMFSVFMRANDNDYINAVRDYEEGFKLYTGTLENDVTKLKTDNV